MQIFVYKNGQQLGPYTEAEIKSQLAAGSLSVQDMIWWEGQAGWAPLAQTALAPTITGMPSVPPAPVAPKKSNKVLIGVLIGCAVLPAVAFVAVVAISVLLALGQTVKGVFSTINSQLEMTETNNPPATTNAAPATNP